MTGPFRLSAKAWRWLAGSWAAVTAVALGANVTAPVERTDPSIPIVRADLTTPPAPYSAADGSGVGEEGGPVLEPAPSPTTTTPPTSATPPRVSSRPKPTTPPVAKPAAQPVAPAPAPLGGRIVAAARTFFGIPYLWGGLSRLGLDCSGLVVLVMRAVGLNPPRTAAQQALWTVRVPASQAQPGDLVFQGSPAFHVGIYIGDGQMIDAQDVGTVVGVHKVQPGSYYGRVPS